MNLVLAFLITFSPIQQDSVVTEEGLQPHIFELHKLYSKDPYKALNLLENALMDAKNNQYQFAIANDAFST